MRHPNVAPVKYMGRAGRIASGVGVISLYRNLSPQIQIIRVRRIHTIPFSKKKKKKMSLTSPEEKINNKNDNII